MINEGVDWLQGEIKRDGAGDYMILMANSNEIRNVEKYVIFTMTELGYEYERINRVFIKDGIRVILRSAQIPELIEGYTFKAVCGIGEFSDKVITQMRRKLAVHQGNFFLNGRIYGYPLLLDNGCPFHNDCFTCPYPDCVWNGRSKEVKSGESKAQERRREALEMVDDGVPDKDIAALLGIALRTLSRYKLNRRRSIVS